VKKKRFPKHQLRRAIGGWPPLDRRHSAAEGASLHVGQLALSGMLRATGGGLPVCSRRRASFGEGQVAKRLRTSPSYVSHLIRVTRDYDSGFICGPPGRARPQRALLKGGATSQEVAASVGHAHLADFDHHSKAHFGITPSTYPRRRVQPPLLGPPAPPRWHAARPPGRTYGHDRTVLALVALAPRRFTRRRIDRRLAMVCTAWIQTTLLVSPSATLLCQWLPMFLIVPARTGATMNRGTRRQDF